jgi:hypothetical protein
MSTTITDQQNSILKKAATLNKSYLALTASPLLGI